MTNYRFPKRMRLLGRREFDRVFAVRASASDGIIVMYGATNELGYPRLGLAVSRKLGRAVARNRWKRVLREAFRLTQHDLPPLDLVCIPRVGAEPDMRCLSRSLPKLARRLARQLERAGRRPAQEDRFAAPFPEQQVVTRSHDGATPPPTAGLLADEDQETDGQENVRGQETRAQQ